MTYQPATLANNSNTLPKLPGWVTPKSGKIPQNIAFLSGATFAMLDVVLQQSGGAIPQKLLANTLALKAAVTTSKLEGRLARETDIRDANTARCGRSATLGARRRCAGLLAQCRAYPA